MNVLPDSNRRQFLRVLAGAGIALVSPGCGTILYPERRGQPKGQLDWGVVGLDGLGLLLFFVPGVIAFAVDFGTGAIYLPPEDYESADTQTTSTHSRLTTLRIAPEELTEDRLASVVGDRLGRPFRFDDTVRRVPLLSLDRFWVERERLIAETDPTAADMTLRAQSR